MEELNYNPAIGADVAFRRLPVLLAPLPLIRKYAILSDLYFNIVKQIIALGSYHFSFFAGKLHIFSDVYSTSSSRGAFDPSANSIFLNPRALLLDYALPHNIDDQFFSLSFQYSLRETLLHELKHWFDHVGNLIRLDKLSYCSYAQYINSREEISANILPTIDILYQCLSLSPRLLVDKKAYIKFLAPVTRYKQLKDKGSYIASLQNAWRRMIGTHIKFPYTTFAYLTD